MTLLSKQVPENNRELVGFVIQSEALGPADESFLGFAGLRDAGQIALDVGCKDGDPRPRQALSQHLQGDGLAGTGGSGDQAVPVRECDSQNLRLAALADENGAVRINVRHGMTLALSSSLCR